MRFKHFNDENAVPMRSDSFSTTGTMFPRVPLEMTPAVVMRRRKETKTTPSLWKNAVSRPEPPA